MLPAQLVARCRRLMASGEAGAVVFVIATGGSTYSKAGNLMLVDGNGDYHGMVSGGCLEGDLAEQARAAMAARCARFVTYDLASDDELFGLGVGCEGRMDLLVQPLAAADAYEPLSTILSALEADRSVEVGVATAASSYAAGACYLQASSGVSALGIEPGASEHVARFLLRAPRQVLLLGAGQDIDPLVDFCRALGWCVTAVDHRAAQLQRLAGRCKTHCIPVADFQAGMPLDDFDAAVVMSHNIRNDRSYLRALAASAIPFVGLLGPPQRRDRLMDELGGAAEKLQDRLHAPVGTRIGGRGPAAIALEIAVELQAWFLGH
jgi:xanthine dehydrogenase accessory factor